MKRILVTGGTVFVSRYVADYYVKQGYEVYCLNRNHYTQVEGTHLIKADRHNLSEELKMLEFDAVIDVTAYNGEDIKCLLGALYKAKDYIMISSSAVYPETLPQPFQEEQEGGPNSIWKDYGTDKYEAENVLLEKRPDAYILRPPYLYGPMQNLYREPFVFDCALAGRSFYVPKNGAMNLQFFYIEDLCRFIDILLEKHPSDHIFNVGNPETVTVREWVTLCYKAAGKIPDIKEVYHSCNQRDYFSFYDYDYRLDVTRQMKLLPSIKPLEDGLKESFLWYKEHESEVQKKAYFDFIDQQPDFKP